MSPREFFALRDHLSPELKGRTISDAHHEVSLTDILHQSCLIGGVRRLSGRAVLLAMSGQLLSALAMIELDGVARRMLLCPPDLNSEHIQALIEDAGIDAIVTDELSQVGFASWYGFPVYEPRTFITSGYQGTLGSGFPTALGAKVANPDKPVVAITGDGGFMFAVQELATAVQFNIGVVTLVFNNNAYGNVRRIQEEHYGNRLIASDLRNPDFVRFAESFGAEADRAKSPKELRAALKLAFKRRDGPTLIEVPVGAMPSPWEFIHMPKVRG